MLPILSCARAATLRKENPLMPSSSSTCRAAARIVATRSRRHPVFGGEAKQNEPEVDGYHLWAPQGSNGNVWPLREARKIGACHDFDRQLALPEQFEWQEAESFPSDMAIAEDVCSPMHIAWERAEQRMFHEGHGRGHGR